MVNQNKQEMETGEVRVKRSLLAQLDRIENLNLTEEEFDKEERRTKAINGITANIIKISSLSIKAKELKLRGHQLGLNDDTLKFDNIMG